MPAEFRGTSDFAEVAEALNVNTDQICAMKLDDGTLTVMYSPSREDFERVYGVQLMRGSDGILSLKSLAVEIPGWWDDIKRQMEGS